VRGFEWAPDQYVVITDEDLERVPLKTVRSIEIELFTKASRDKGTVRFVKSAYYVEPDKVGQKAFSLLKSVLADKGLTAICKVVIKDREALAALDPYEKTMLLSTLHWPDEIRSTAELDLPEEKVEFKPAEKAMAEQLVAAMTGEFEPEEYHDEYREALMRVIQEKVEGKEITEAPEPVPAGKLVDLMAALEASVSAAKSSRAGQAPVSVKEAKAAKEKAREAPAAAKSRARTRKAAGDEAEEAEARPARRRKSA
jgi:DNA end-binding protein Ku